MTGLDQNSMKLASQAERLELLMDYTKFHIGLYATVITILLALATIGVEQQHISEYLKTPVMITVACMLIAGACGGMVAGNLPEQKSFDEYWNNPIFPFGIRIKGMKIPTRWWARLEHLAFWIGVANAFAAVVWGDSYLFASAQGPAPAIANP